MTITDTGKTTWTEDAEEQGKDVEFHAYPDYVVAMAMLEQQKRIADALEQIADLLGHITIKYVDARVVVDKSAEAKPDNPVSELGW